MTAADIPADAKLRRELAAVAERRPDAPFAWVDGESHSYAAAQAMAEVCAPWLGPGRAAALVLEKRAETYALIWSAIVCGATYMPLNPHWNVARLRDVIEDVRPDTVVSAAGWSAQNDGWLRELGYGAPQPVEPINEAADREPLVRREREADGESAFAAYRRETGAPDMLYAMFTSGSTGRPKGVPIPEPCAHHYIAAMREVFAVEEGERWMQAVELSFDLSVHDTLMAWTTGGSVVSMPAAQAPMAPRYVKRLEIHNWMSVPSAAARAHTLGLLKEGGLPSLRRSFFCGEVLPTDIAALWHRTAPNSRVLNIYGPTETTVISTWHDFDPQTDTRTSVPVGRTLPRIALDLVPVGEDAEVRDFVEDGGESGEEEGEIVIGGPQVFYGYLGNAEETAKRLRVGPDGARRYHTGDRGRRLPDGTLLFLGRLDWQVKLRGHRIETDEVEYALRAASGSALVAAVPTGETVPGSFEDLHAFVQGEVPADMRERLAERLPSYMRPATVRGLREFPRNANGKIDRNALARLALEEPQDAEAPQGRVDA